MKRLSEKAILTVVFYVLIFLAMGVVLVMKYRSTDTGAAEDAAPDTPAPTVTPYITPKPGVELERLLYVLGNAEVRVTETDDPLVYYVRDPERSGRMRLTLSEKDDLVYAAALDFFIGSKPTPTPSVRFSNKLWGLMGEHKKDEAEKQNRSLEKMVRALAKSLLQRNPPAEATILTWYDGAVDARDQESDYESKESGAVFSASATMDGGDSVLRLSLILN